VICATIIPEQGVGGGSSQDEALGGLAMHLSTEAFPAEDTTGHQPVT
jgi:hypothetical protein